MLSLAAAPMRMDAQAAPFVASAGVGIDHLILGVDDLARGMAEFTLRTGVVPVKGGVHPGRGTQNALASLGDGKYIEILAPSNEPGTTRNSSTMSATLKPVGWALHTTQIAAVIAGMRNAGFEMSDVRPGARARPDGVMLSWQTAAVTGNDLTMAPFFIQWGTDAPHPSTASPPGCHLKAAMITDPRPAPLAKFLSTAGVNMVVRAGTERRMGILLECPRGNVAF